MTTRTEPPPGLGRPLAGLACALVVGAFAALLDTTIVGVAVHTLAGAFSADLAATQWVTTAYLLAVAAVIPATGWAAARFGAGRAWTVSLAVFLAGSVLCGAAWSLPSLVAFRALQGAGAGMLFPLSRIIVVEAAGRERLGRMMALMAIPVPLAPVLGPVVGGLVLETLSWRWVFFLNVPFLLAGIALSAACVPGGRRDGGARLDVAGLAAVSGGVTLLVLGLTGDHAWPSAAGAALLGLYAWRHVRARHGGPHVVDLGLFRDRAFSASAALGLLANAALYAAVFLVPLLFQQAGGTGALGAGLVLAPQGLGMLAAVLAAGRLVDLRANPRALVLAGLAAVAAGTLPFVLPFAQDASAPGGVTPLLAAALFVRGAGMAFAVAPTMTTLYHSLPRSSTADATTANAVLQQVGAAAGTAAVAVLLDRADGFAPAFWATLAAVALCAVPALFLPGQSTER
ncbi:DHA2 family efflux MFS transporter permease subunit [Nonomuraea pusilla]|uniref:Drug resistance transporter, EmrB/QacA subfamily n=1 Tax=Nonomuraea pusilla TaxID=46177 RepID=A0A1H7WZ41_9ACTN|nr:DHA2 family efflux MFS transporter permease subunit [Nonomuraea pusilla]SEM26896.1 drug resistance transporter, EmrB/QacA subfamily [Nonomuraea pusilla]